MLLVYGITSLSPPRAPVVLGDYSWVRQSTGRELLTNAAGVGYAFRCRMSCPVVGFRVFGQADAAVKMAAVEAALAVQGGDLVFENDDGSPSVNSVLAAACLVPPRCTRLTWSDKPGAQFLTWREFSCEFEWEVALPTGYPTLLEFSESVTVEGGTPRKVVIECINAPPVEQITSPQQKYAVTQRGYAVGLSAFPPAATPLYANPVRNPVTRTSPDRFGAGYRGYRCEWLYFWEFAAAPTGAAPSLWVG